MSAGIEEFSQIPADMAERKKFADLFQSFNENLEAAKVQGFEWDKPIVIINEDADEKTELHADFDERTFKVLALRYKELFTPNPDGSENDPDDDVPYAVNSYLTTIDTADIDTDYMNSRFEKYLKISIRRVQKQKPFIRPKRSCTRPLPPSRRKNRNMRIFSCTTFRAGQLSRSRERPCGSILPSTSPKSRTTRSTK